MMLLRGRRPSGTATPAAAAALLLAASWAPAPAQGAEAREQLFSQDWYYTEVVVFQRPGVQDHAAQEQLARPPEPLPRSLRSFRASPEDRASVFRLYPLTRAFLTFPHLDHARLTDVFRDDDALDAQEADEQAPDPDADADRAASPAGVEPPAIEPRLAPDPLVDFLRELAEYEAALEQDSYRWLEQDTFTLNAIARRLARRDDHQVLLHGRWLQPVPPRETPQPLLIQTGHRYPGTFALEGTFHVTLGRYLHFRADLYYTEPLLGRAPLDRALAPEHAVTLALSGDDQPRLSGQDLTRAGFVQLRESRRVRSGELHYLDHPKLGVLVRIEPVTPPESLSAAHAALEEEQP